MRCVFLTTVAILTVAILSPALAPITVASGGKSGQIPVAVNSMLQKKFPGWRFSKVSSEVEQFFRERFPDAYPNIINGDFDGNGQLDWAVLIEHSNFDKRGVTYRHLVEILAFLKRGTRYKLYILEDSAPENLELYMTLARKGEEGRNFHTQKRFKYPNDSISVSYFEKAGGTYIYSKGRFQYVIESD